MLALTIASLFTLAAFASLLTLVDCWIRGRYEFVRLGQERALIDAGFTPTPAALEQRVRQPAVRFEALATPARLPVLRALPDHRLAPVRARACGAA